MSNIKHRAIQLTVKENAVGFDYHAWYDSVIIATPGSISFHRIADNGTPHQLLHYDELRSFRGIRIQQNDKALVAALHKHEITIWDPSHPVAPMTHSVVASSGVTDGQWSHENPNLLSMTLDTGMISIWDCRSWNRPVQQLLFGKRSQKMEWCPVDPYLVAVSAENKYVLLWDIRMLPLSGLSSATPKVDDCYMVLEPETGLTDFTWACDISQKIPNSTSCPFLWTVSDKSRNLELHRITRIHHAFSSSLEISHPSKACVTNSKIVAQQNGQGLMIYYSDCNESKVYTKFNFLDVKHHQNIDGDSFIAKSCGKILGGHWRQHGLYNSVDQCQKSFIACTESGHLHVFDWIKRKHSNSYDEKCHVKSKLMPHVDNTLSTTSHSLVSKYKGRFLVSNLKSMIGMSAIKDDDIDLDSPGITTNRFVVGPKTFLLLLKDDLSALDQACRHGNLEGIRVGALDHFTRQIVLEVLIPSADQFTINNFNANFNSHFRKEELLDFYAKGAPNRIVELSMIFPIKTNQFWVTPKIALENKSSQPMDQETLSSITNEISSLIRTRALERSQALKNGGRNIGTKTTESVGESILMQVAKLVTKRILKLWEKKTDGERLNFSLGSLKQSQDNISTVSQESQREVDVVQDLYLQYVEPRAFRVPFPVVSGGVFNGKGELILFGNGQLTLKTTPTRSLCSLVKNIPMAAFPGGGNIELSNQDKDKSRKHKSFANLMVNKFIKKATSEGIITANSSGSSRASGESNTISTKLSTSQHSNGLSVSQHSQLRRVSRRCGANLGLIIDDDNDDAQSGEVGSDDEMSSGHSKVSQDNSSLEEYDDFDYHPGYDFEESKGSSTLDMKSKRRVSYNNSGQQLEALLPVRKYSNLSDYSSTQYFVADLESKPSDAGFENDRKMCQEPIVFTVYGSIHPCTILLGCGYALGPIKIDQSWQDDLPARISACRYNIEVTEKYSPLNHALIQFWSLLAVALEVSAITDVGGLISWNQSVLGKSLFQRLVVYLLGCKDLQTWAAAICVVGNSRALLNLLSVDQQRSILATIMSRKDPRTSISNPAAITAILTTHFETIVYRYSCLLQQWGDLLKSTEVLNHMINTDEMEEHQSDSIMRFPIPRSQLDRLSLSICCMFCNSEVQCRNDLEYSVAVWRKNMSKSDSVSKPYMEYKQSINMKPWCLECNVFGIYCSICLLPVRSVASICELCGHGGHESDLVAWFSKHSECPTGCGCKCRSYEEDDVIDDEVIRFVDDESEFLPTSPERNANTSSNNIIAYHNSNAIVGNVKTKHPTSSVFRTISFRLISQPHYLSSLSNVGDYGHFSYNNFFFDES